MYNHKTKKWRGSIGLLVLLLLSNFCFLPLSQMPLAQAANNFTWKDTGIKFSDTPPSGILQVFLDTTTPNTLYYGVSKVNGYFVFSVDLKTGTSKMLGDDSYFPELIYDTYAGFNGYVFGRTTKYINDVPQNSFKQLSHNNLTGTRIDHMPTYSGVDGSLITYSLDKPDWSEANPPRNQSHLWVSLNGGLTWQERGQQLPGAFVEYSASQSDAKNLYILVREPGDDASTYKLTLYFSADAGVNWEKRNQFIAPKNAPSGVRLLPGNSAPVDAVMFINWPPAQANGYNNAISLDGGRTFQPLEENCSSACVNFGTVNNFRPQYWFGKNSLLRLNYNQEQQRVEMGASFDGQLWNSWSIPNEAQGLKGLTVQVAPFSPSNLLLTGYQGQNTGIFSAWYSDDEGKNWQLLPDTMNMYIFTPYQPLALVGMKDHEIYTMDLPDSGKQLIARTASNKATSGTYFNETGHNLNGAFKQYWEQNGGLAQFGYPRTDPFLELNPADGRVYLAQYFERNRLEYHPENAGTPYEVQLGLLGNQLTSGRSQELPFKKIASFVSRPNNLYFAETGHSLNYGFKAYWEQNGGLGIYGYPISEEFQEVNPDDGKTYTVQYFERARFEYHPENAGTKFEVLLGLLGNATLRLKSWL